MRLPTKYRALQQCSTEQRQQWIEFFDEVDVHQRLPAGPIPTDIWIPESREDVEKHMEEIGYKKPIAEEIEGMWTSNYQ